jgi:hypothetical protein
MKHLLFSVFVLVLSVNSYGMIRDTTAPTIDTTITNCTAAKIVPVAYSHGLPATVDTLTHLGVFNYTDNLTGDCRVSYSIMSISSGLRPVMYNVMTNAKNIIYSTYKLTDVQYTAWDGTPTMLLSFLAQYLNLTFK